MTDDQRQPRKRDSAATRQLLVDAAATLIASVGYEAATTKAIASAAGCSEVLIQRYFDGKEGLLLAVVRQQRASTPDDPFFQRPLCRTMEVEFAENFEQSLASFAKRAPHISILLSRALVDEKFRSDFQSTSMRGHVRSLLVERYGRYRAAGLVSPATDLDALAEMTMTLVFQIAFMQAALLKTDMEDIVSMARSFAALLAHGVATKDITGVSE